MTKMLMLKQFRCADNLNIDMSQPQYLIECYSHTQ